MVKEKTFSYIGQSAVCEIPGGPIERGYQKLALAFPVVIIMDLLSMKIFRSMKDLQMLDRDLCIFIFGLLVPSNNLT